MDGKGPLLERLNAAGGEASGTWEVGGVSAPRRQGMGVHPDQNTGGINLRRNPVVRPQGGRSDQDRGALRAQSFASDWGGGGGIGKGIGENRKRGLRSFSVGGPPARVLDPSRRKSRRAGCKEMGVLYPMLSPAHMKNKINPNRYVDGSGGDCRVDYHSCVDSDFREMGRQALMGFYPVGCPGSLLGKGVEQRSTTEPQQCYFQASPPPRAGPTSPASYGVRTLETWTLFKSV